MDDKKDALLQPDQKEETKTEEKKDPSDALTPDHPRFKQVLEKLHEKDTVIEQLKTQLDDLSTKIEARQEKTGEDELTAEEQATLDRIELNLLKRGKFVSSEEIEKERRISSRATQIEKLSDRYDGKNGYPKFITEDVIEHAKRQGFGDNLTAAYRDLHFKTIVEVEAKKQTAGPTPPSSERPTGTEHEVTAGLTPSKIAAMSDQEFAEREAEIMAGFKKSVTGR